jgi:hypothetical protein
MVDYPPTNEEENYEGELSNCCGSPMLEGNDQCMTCGADGKELLTNEIDNA